MWIFLFICHSEVFGLDNLLRNPAIFKNKEEEYDFSNMFHFNQSQNNEEEDYDFWDANENSTHFNQSQNITFLGANENTTCLSFLDGESTFKCNTFKPFLNVIIPFMIILGVFLIVWFEPIIWRKR